MYDAVIIGAGASGLLAAIYACNGKNRIAVLERNNFPAKKLFATGNGHCNYLNTNAKHFEVLNNELGLLGIVGTEENTRMYPKNKEAASVVNVLVSRARNKGAEIICDFHAADVMKTANGFKIRSKDDRIIESKMLVIASGGKAGIQYGCYGEGYRWVQSFGHNLVKPIPALVGLDCEENTEMLHGVRVMGKVSLLKNGNETASDIGEVQFTKDSVSGICVMNLSRYVRFDEDSAFELGIDFFPELSSEDLKELLEKQKSLLGDSMESLIPKKLKEYIQANCSFVDDSELLASKLKDFRFSVRGTLGWNFAQVTSGGVSMNELCDTYESKKVSGLFIVGEMTDYDGPCGGYNLSHAFWSGMCAGKAIAERGLDS